MKVAGNVVGINEQRLIRDIPGAGRQLGGATIGESRAGGIIPARGGAVVINNGIPGVHAVHASAVAAITERTLARVISIDSALRNTASKRPAPEQSQIIGYVAVRSLAVVKTAGVIMRRIPDHL